MKLAVINTTGGPGSTIGEFITSLNDGLRQKGIEVVVAVGRGQGDLVLGSRWRHRFNALQARFCDNDGFLDRRATKKICRWLEAQQPDVVHLHNLHGYYLDMRLLVECLRNIRCKVIVTLHDNWLLTGHCAKIPSKCQEFYSGDCRTCQFNKAYPAAYRLKQTFDKRKTKSTLLHSLPDLTIVSPTEAYARIMCDSDLSDLTPVVIPNGVSPVFFAEREKRRMKQRDSSKRLLAAARKWIDIKNPEALYKLAEVMPENWTLTIVGDIEKPRIKPNIVYAGRVESAQEMASLYASHDVFLMPSHNEAFGLVTAEALACGTPVVVNGELAGAELLSADDGFACDFSDIPTLIESIKAAFEKIPRSRYTMQSMTEAYARLLTKSLFNNKC